MLLSTVVKLKGLQLSSRGCEAPFNQIAKGITWGTKGLKSLDIVLWGAIHSIEHRGVYPELLELGVRSLLKSNIRG